MTDVGHWRKSSYSAAVHQDCLEVWQAPTEVRLRDTKNRHLGHLTFPGQEWTAFLTDLKTRDL